MRASHQTDSTAISRVPRLIAIMSQAAIRMSGTNPGESLNAVIYQSRAALKGTVHLVVGLEALVMSFFYREVLSAVLVVVSILQSLFGMDEYSPSKAARDWLPSLARRHHGTRTSAPTDRTNRREAARSASNTGWGRIGTKEP